MGEGRLFLSNKEEYAEVMCWVPGTIEMHGINIENPDYEYQETFRGTTYFNSELRTIEDDIQWLREIMERDESYG